MDINDILGGGISDSNDGEKMTELEKLGATAALTGMAHAMCDYVLSSEDNFQKFCQMLDVSGDDAENVRQSMRIAHDTFAGMAARSTQTMMVTAMFNPDGGKFLTQMMGEDDDNPGGGMYI